MATQQIIQGTELRRHPAVRAWLTLGANRDLPSRLEIVYQKRKGGVYRLVGAGPRGSNVIGKRCRSGKGAIERAVYESIMPQLARPPYAYYGAVTNDDAAWSWLLLEDIGDKRFEPHSELHRALAAQWLGRLHAAIKREHVPVSLPTRDAVSYRARLESIVAALARLRECVRSDRRGRALIRQLTEHCAAIDSRWPAVDRWCADVPAVFSHNDCLPKNIRMRATSGGPHVALFDWGGAGWAPAGADLGLLALPQEGLPDIEPDLAAYRAALAERWPDLDSEPIRRAACIGQLFWGLKVIDMELPELASAWRQPERMLNRLAIYDGALARSLAVIDTDARGR